MDNDREADRGGSGAGDGGHRRADAPSADAPNPIPGTVAAGDRTGRDPRWTIARRELASLRSEKTILLALVIQLFVAAFSSFLVVGLVSLYDPGAAAGYSVETAVAGDDTGDLALALERTDGMEPRRYPTRQAAADAFADGRVDAAMLATATERGTVEVRVLVPEGSVGTTLVVVRAREALRAFERLERDQRSASLSAETLALPPQAGSSPYFGFTYTVLVPLLLFLPVFIAGSVTVDSLTEELERGTLELLRVAPVTMTNIVEGKLLAAAGLAPVQAALWLALLSVNGTAIAPAPSALVTAAGVVGLLGLTAGLAALVTALGAALALTAPDRRAAQTVYSLGVLGLFGAAALSPANPANVAAKLAVGSADPASYLVVVAVLVAGGVAVWVARAGVARYGPA
ncbi:ABC-type Na+ efflux pump, permease component [Halobaculum gomorrense]|uniref:ABC-type Na+ efflux pump, permease component n=1 Tax=Halobaculum gomorrense TaxID=43928 RepID=A0A1M5UL01_9EURY|nr:ABC-type Na+ efflux pump, permease component [Halobaculum gomorrense]